MKIGVYAIARNEAVNVQPWLKAVSEADAVCVTDTGSTDDTAALLEAGGAKVSHFTEAFRFDKARNFALAQAKAYAPDVDIWVSLDLDEWPEKGWYKKFAAHTSGMRGWRITIDNGSYSFQNIRAHRPEGWRWEHACHEVLYGDGPIGDSGFKVVHHQDLGKPRDYLPLLELDVKENPGDGRAWHYLGREYMYLGEWDKAIDALDKAFIYDGWSEQRSASAIFSSRCYWHKGNMRGAVTDAWEAVHTFGSREAWVHLAWLLDKLGDPTAGIAAENALKIRKHGTYPSEPGAWGPLAGVIARKWSEA